MPDINIWKDFSIDSYEKCSTAEWVYLAIRSGYFDDKLETALKILHRKEKFLDIEDEVEFWDLIFSSNIEEQGQQDIKKILKEVFLWWRHKLFNEHFSKLLEEVIDNLLFKNSSVYDFSDSISEKVSTTLYFSSSDNISNINPKLHWYSDLELFTYLLSDSWLQHIKDLWALDEVKSRLEKNPRVLESFLTSESRIKSIWDIFIDLYTDYDDSTWWDLNLANRQSLQEKIVQVLLWLEVSYAWKIINSFNNTIHWKDLILNFLRKKREDEIIFYGITFLRELDESKNVESFLKLLKYLNRSISFPFNSFIDIFCSEWKIEDRVENLFSFYSFLVDNNIEVDNGLEHLKDIKDYLILNRSRKPIFEILTPSIYKLLRERYEKQTKTWN